jgi:hypothetical protein
MGEVMKLQPLDSPKNEIAYLDPHNFARLFDEFPSNAFY